MGFSSHSLQCNSSALNTESFLAAVKTSHSLSETEVLQSVVSMEMEHLKATFGHIRCCHGNHTKHTGRPPGGVIVHKAVLLCEVCGLCNHHIHVQY